MMLLNRLAVTASLIAATACAYAAPVTSQGTWETTLKARDINGKAVELGSANAAFFYDTTLNITWLANMNQGGKMNWSAANAWADGLTLGGFDDWRLPTVTSGRLGYNLPLQESGAHDEWAHLFYETLGNTHSLTSMNSLTNTAFFQNMQGWSYWNNTEYSRNPSGAWYFSALDGYQGLDYKFFENYAVAVRSGDVLNVPEPQSLALVLMALAGLGAAARRRRAA